jgi:hypothetical protein
MSSTMTAVITPAGPLQWLCSYYGQPLSHYFYVARRAATALPDPDRRFGPLQIANRVPVQLACAGKPVPRALE